MSYDMTFTGAASAFIDLDGNSGTAGDKGMLLGSPSLLRSELTGRVVGYGLNQYKESNNFFSVGGDTDKSLFDKSNENGPEFIFDFFLDSSGFKDGDEENQAQFGEQFGSSIVTCDFNGDGLQDIAVGAPTWFLKTDQAFGMDIGRVYVFLQKAGGNKNGFSQTTADLFEPATIISSPAGEGGHFGKSLACSGDLNDDKFDDLVVSAPFANDGSGIVYVFNGGPNCEDCSHSGFQQEAPSQNFTSPNTDASTGKSNDWFGFKLNFESDIDGNEYRDLTVSSPKSEQLFIYKTRPSINTEVTIKTDKEPLPYKLNEKQISNVEICAKYSGKGLPKTMAGSIQIELDVGTSNKRIYKKSESKFYFLTSDSWTSKYTTKGTV